MPAIDRDQLVAKVQAMYRDVAERPEGEFHFETGRALAERLGNRAADLDRIPAEAVASFAGVGSHFHFLDQMEGARVLDLGSGSGTDTFVARLIVGPTGSVIGLDMTAAQRVKAESLRRRQGVRNITCVRGMIDDAPFEDGSFDVVISNGVINLAVDKPRVFREAARLFVEGRSSDASNVARVAGPRVGVGEQTSRAGAHRPRRAPPRSASAAAVVPSTPGAPGPRPGPGSRASRSAPASGNSLKSIRLLA